MLPTVSKLKLHSLWISSLIPVQVILNPLLFDVSRTMKSLENTHRAGIFAMLLLTSLSPVGQTQRPSATDEAAEVSKTGAITGRVIDESGQPLSNAFVSIRTYAGMAPGWGATTVSEGNFKVDGLERVVYLVSASVPAYTLRPRDPDSTQSNIYRVGDSVPLVLMKGGAIP